MPKAFRHAAIVGKFQARGIAPVLEEIAHFLAGRGLEVFFERDTAQAMGATATGRHGSTARVGDVGGIGGYEALTPEELGRRCEIAIVVGGDGTMLGFAREMARFHVPLVGINAGRLGFITDIPLERYKESLAPILAGDYEEEHRSMLEGGVWRQSNGVAECIYEGLSLNDVVVSRGGTAGMVELRVDVDDDFVANLRADGLIVSTPTGSTAYALSAGGPILHPAIGGWVVVPIASHTLSNRPIVLPDAGEVKIGIVAGKDVSASFDMHNLASLLHGDQIRVRRSAHQVRFLHPRGWSYYATLRRKLRWYEGGV
ncbi:MAG: NAD kinase [Betaproteobacteria bacterium]|nr:NAD kinase [Betaproteobacteria bacterium]MCC6248839.1 NAD kinase [Rubrivivax sp.]MCL4699201.1 NAD kinase [Burkholderiaceae bacterium]